MLKHPQLHDLVSLNKFLWLVQLALCWLLSSAFNAISLSCFMILLLLKWLQLAKHWRSWQLKESNGVAAALILLFVATNYSAGILAMMIHLLYLAALLRLLGFRPSEQQDVQQLLLVHYVLFACVFILTQDLISTLAALLALMIQLCAHYIAFASQAFKLHLKSIGKTLIVLLPLWALLFLFLPRLPPLWQLNPQIAKTGLAESISVGSITQLVASDALVFRAEFNAEPPAIADLYWRARVYLHFDGEQWHQATRTPSLALSKVLTGATTLPSSIEYKLLIEPHQQQHLFTLAQPVAIPAGARLTSTSLLMLQRPLLQQQQFTLQSVIQPVLQDAALSDATLKLPAGNPKSRVLAKQLVQQLRSSDPAQHAGQLVQLITEYLQQQGFVYSLTPPQLQGQQIDQFLFASKSGFCSHYAQAAVFLLRAAGVPSRIVGGYLGGTWQANGRYLQVRQKEAHAWVEYYQQGQWHRFDPTLAVAPARAYLTLDELFATNQQIGPMVQFLQNHWQRWLLQPLADLDYFWSRWILGFDQAQQWQLWQQLQDSAGKIHQQINQLSEMLSEGLAQPSITSWFKPQLDWMVLLASLLFISGIVLQPQIARKRRLKQLLQDPANYLLQRLPLSTKRPDQTIESYLLQLAQQHPALQPQLDRLNQLYQQLVFAKVSRSREQQELLQLIQDLQRKEELRSE